MADEVHSIFLADFRSFERKVDIWGFEVAKFGVKAVKKRHGL